MWTRETGELLRGLRGTVWWPHSEGGDGRLVQDQKHGRAWVILYKVNQKIVEVVWFWLSFHGIRYLVYFSDNNYVWTQENQMDSSYFFMHIVLYTQSCCIKMEPCWEDRAIKQEQPYKHPIPNNSGFHSTLPISSSQWETHPAPSPLNPSACLHHLGLPPYPLSLMTSSRPLLLALSQELLNTCPQPSLTPCVLSDSPSLLTANITALVQTRCLY